MIFGYGTKVTEMAHVIDLMSAKIDRLALLEATVQRKLSRVLGAMNINRGESDVALHLALLCVRHGRGEAKATHEALNYARGREIEHGRERATEWYKRDSSRFIPAWHDPDGAA